MREVGKKRQESDRGVIEWNRLERKRVAVMQALLYQKCHAMQCDVMRCE